MKARVPLTRTKGCVAATTRGAGGIGAALYLRWWSLEVVELPEVLFVL